jgi:hypothetical protein
VAVRESGGAVLTIETIKTIFSLEEIQRKHRPSNLHSSTLAIDMGKYRQSQREGSIHADRGHLFSYLKGRLCRAEPMPGP